MSTTLGRRPQRITAMSATVQPTSLTMMSMSPQRHPPRATLTTMLTRTETSATMVRRKPRAPSTNCKKKLDQVALQINVEELTQRISARSWTMTETATTTVPSTETRITESSAPTRAWSSTTAPPTISTTSERIGVITSTVALALVKYSESLSEFYSLHKARKQDLLSSVT